MHPAPSCQSGPVGRGDAPRILLPTGKQPTIIAPVPRRVHVLQVRAGTVPLSRDESHHVRDVLRLDAGAEVELFDDAGNVGAGVLEYDGPRVLARVRQVLPPVRPAVHWTIASAVPKGNRADWMIEKLSELGCPRFVPLAAERSVVLPKGENKRSRWLRLAIEAGKQSHRRGTMEIADMATPAQLLTPSPSQGEGEQEAWYLSPASSAVPVRDLVLRPLPHRLTLFIGPEGGWSPAEIELFARLDVTPVRLTETVLRVETAAVAAAAVVASAFVPNPPPHP